MSEQETIAVLKEQLAVLSETQAERDRYRLALQQIVFYADEGDKIAAIAVRALEGKL